MQIKPTRSGASEFLKTFNAAFSDSWVLSKQDPERLFNLRCSQIPYCPNSVLQNFGERGMQQATNAMSAYYFAVGHAVHDVMQRYLQESGQLIADYTCRECGKKYPLSMKYECCGYPTKYEEITIEYKGIVGHIDAVFKDSAGRIWIIDFKTSSTASAPAKGRKPSAGYSLQVRAYAYLLGKQYGLDVYGCMLVFLPRDNPKTPAIWEHKMTPREYTKVRNELIEQKALHKLTMACESVTQYKRLLKSRCGGDYCRYCKRSDKQLLGAFTRFVKSGKYPISKYRKLKAITKE